VRGRIGSWSSRSSPDRSLWLRWMMANLVGITVGGAIGGAIGRALELPYLGVAPASETMLVLARAAGTASAVFGVAVGTMQWLAIRKNLKHVGWWIPATILAWALAGLVAGTLSGIMGGAVTGVGPDLGLLGYLVSSTVGILAIGLLPAGSQALVLRGRVHGASQWVWGAGGAFFLSILVAFAVVRLGLVNLIGWFRPEDFPSAKAFVLIGALAGLLYAAVSGALLVRLLGRSLSERAARQK
jgi:hypothetical protein